MVSAAAKPSQPGIAAAWQALAAIPDPEVPVVSIVELGIVRDVACDANGPLRIALTPTYSGCPATAVIEATVRERLRATGFDPVVVEQRIAPPWTTDWIAPEARDRLRAFGIAPPAPAGGRGSPDASDGVTREAPAPARVDVCALVRSRRADPVPCPRCGSTGTERLSQFGSTPCKAQFRCRDCLEPFDHFKPH